MPLHKDLTGSDLHEPKGAAGAGANTLYVFNGSGSGTVKKITEDSLDLTTMISPNIYYLSAVLSDVSTASSVLVAIPENSVFLAAQLTLGGTLTVDDANVSFTRNDGSSFGTPVVVEYAGSSEGTTFGFTTSLNETVTGPGYIKITTDGGSTGAQPLYITLKLSRDF